MELPRVVARHQSNKKMKEVDLSLQKILIDVLPDECMLHVFSFLSDPADRCRSAAVSRKWLVYQLNLRRCSLLSSTQPADDKLDMEASRSLEGEMANDFRLAALAIGVYPRVLTELELFANLAWNRPLNLRRQHEVVTDLGLSIVGLTCPALKSLTLWSCDLVTDDGVAYIARGCRALEKFNLYSSSVGDACLMLVAKNCPKLTQLHFDTCSSISDQTLRAIAQHSCNLRRIFLTRCPLISDSGIVSLLMGVSTLLKMKLGYLKISDEVLQAMACHGVSLETLSLHSVSGVTELGYSFLGAAEKLKALSLASCTGLTDRSFAILATTTCFTNFTRINIKNCVSFTDLVLIELTKRTRKLVNLTLQQCNEITTHGLISALLNCRETLKLLSLIECDQIGAMPKQETTEPVLAVEALKINKCNMVGEWFLRWLAAACSRSAKRITLVGMSSLDDAILLAFLDALNDASQVTRMELNNCVQIGDRGVLPLLANLGWRLKWLSLAGCKELSDVSLGCIGDMCPNLQELDLSRCQVSDHTLLRMANAPDLSLTMLALAGCHRVTDSGLALLHQHQRMGWNLKVLNLIGCSGITSLGVQATRDALWWCDLDV